ncbi:MAG: ABC transporter ATP-binding protein [Candidatus Borkfalkiaceae bacterium]|nr:ABC transporter ATP-binding protein [Christensenellaceae bacterium]
MKKLFSHLKKYKRDCVLAPLFKLCEATLELLIPLIVADIIDRGVKGGQRQTVIADFILMIGCGLAGLAFSLAGQFFSARAATGFSTDVRGSLFAKLLRLPLGKTDRMGVSPMITRMTSDVNQLQTGTNLVLRLMLRSPFVVLGALVAAILIDVRVSLVFVAVILALSVAVALIMKSTMPRYGEAQRRLDEVSSVARDNLTGVRVIRAFGVEEDEIRSYKSKTEAFEKFQNGVGRISSLLNPLTFALVNCAIVALLYVSGVRVGQGDLTQGQTVALYDYMSQILIELVKFANLIVSVSKALACGKRIDAVLCEDESLPLPAEGKISDAYIEYKNVSVRYGDGGESLSDVSFRVEKGQTVGVIGGTGSGKSTLVNLLPALYRPSCGTVSIAGKDVGGYSAEELHGLVGIALQRPALFHGTIASNLRFGREELSDDGLLEAAEVAQGSDVLAVKGGLTAEAEQGGKNFSGGQRQRLSVARAIAGKPEILILDDSSSALDYATDLRLRRSIHSLSPKPTVFIVSQRTASVRNADLILVLDEGRIVGRGTHEELMKTCETYREIHLSQVKGDE